MALCRVGDGRQRQRPTRGKGGIHETADRPNCAVPVYRRSIQSLAINLCRRLGLLKGASLDVLRHSHASLLLEKGVDLATVSERLGHSSVRTAADISSHEIRGKDQAAAQVWDDIIQGARAGKPMGVNPRLAMSTKVRGSWSMADF